MKSGRVRFQSERAWRQGWEGKIILPQIRQQRASIFKHIMVTLGMFGKRSESPAAVCKTVYPGSIPGVASNFKSKSTTGSAPWAMRSGAEARTIVR